MIKRNLSAILCGAMLLAGASVFAADKTYQVTGPILEVTPTYIMVKKGQDSWKVMRDESTKITGDLKVGAKVTIYYKMVATDVEVKAGKGEKK
jgi:hypothetical protein